MRFPDWLSNRRWLLFAPLLAGAWLAFTAGHDIHHARYVEHLGDVGPLKSDAKSPTGLAGGMRTFIAQEHNQESYQWIAQTQLMASRGTWRLRHVDYDNAPEGREVHTASPYRWWLALLGHVHGWFSATPTAAAIERAAVLANPLLHGLLILAAAGYIAAVFGPGPAVAASIAMVGLFPLGGAFPAGQPDDFSLSVIFALGSVLPLAAGLWRNDNSAARRHFLAAGILGGMGLWIDVTVQAMLLAGITAGALLIRWLPGRGAGAGRTAEAAPAPWRTWATAGAITTLVAYALEYLPGHHAWTRWEVNHPLYAVAWLTAGELLARLAHNPRHDESRRARDLVTAAVAGVVVLGTIAAVAYHASHAAWPVDSAANRVSGLPGHAPAENLAAWLAHGGTSAVLATLLPLSLLGLGVGMVFRGGLEAPRQRALGLTLAPAGLALGIACAQLRWWNLLDVLLVALLALTGAVATSRGGRWRAAWMALLVVSCVPGLLHLARSGDPAAPESVTDAEVVALIERDLAHWLARRAGPDGAIVLAPPSLTGALCYHGGLRGLGSPYWENQAGFAIAVRMAGATSPDEAEALIRRREVTHVILPSWDPFMLEYARLATNEPEQSLAALLQRWLPPRWLQPIAYPLPAIAGMEDDFAAIFAVVDVQDNATALSRLAEYFLEMGQAQPALALSRALKESFSTDLGALTTRAQIALAMRNAPEVRELANAIMPFVERGDDLDLPWDRRISLALVLLNLQQRELARGRLEDCLYEADDARIRRLSPSTLYRLVAALESLGLDFPEPALGALARELVSAGVERPE